MRRNHLPVLFLLLLCTCGGVATEQIVPAEPAPPTKTTTSTPVVEVPASTPISTRPSSLTSAVTPSVVRATTTPVSSPTPTETTPTAAAPIPLRGSFLIAYGERGKLTLAQVNPEGDIRPLDELLGMSDSYWRDSLLSPDGVWLAYYSGDGAEWRLRNLRTGEDISLGELGEVSTPIFDATSQRFAFLESVYPYTAGGDTWSIHVRDLTTGVETLFRGPIVVPGHLDDEPLRGEPVAWAGDELLVDTLVPPESPHQGIWTLNVSSIVPGETVSLRRYDRLVLSSQDVEYMEPTLSPDGTMLAFPVWDYDHRPFCLDDPFGATTGLGVVPVVGGSARLLVDVTGTNSALAGQPLAWSPDGSQILFAQGTCQETSPRFEPTLRAVDLQGNVEREWPLARLEDTCCQEALWCMPEQIFYLHGENQLWRLNVETGQNEQVLTSERIQLIGCLP